MITYRKGSCLNTSPQRSLTLHGPYLLNSGSSSQARGEVHMYLSKVQVLRHLLKYKYKYMPLFWEKYLSKMQVLLEVFYYKYHTRENFGREKFW